MARQKLKETEKLFTDLQALLEDGLTLTEAAAKLNVKRALCYNRIIRFYSKEKVENIVFRDRFYKKVDKDEFGCWTWTGAKVCGYGIIHNKSHSITAARVAWEFEYGKILTAEVIEHICCNKLCVNPAHLKLQTKQQLMSRIGKIYGKNNTGPSQFRKLTDEQVIQLRADYIPGKVGAGTLAKKYGLGEATVRKILKNETYKK